MAGPSFHPSIPHSNQDQRRRLSRLSGFIGEIEQRVCLRPYIDLQPRLDQDFTRIIWTIKLIHEILSASPLNDETPSDSESQLRKKLEEAEAKRQKDVEDGLIMLGRDVADRFVIQTPPDVSVIHGVDMTKPPPSIHPNAWRDGNARWSLDEQPRQKGRFEPLLMTSADCYFRPLKLDGREAIEEREKNQNSPDSGLPPTPPVTMVAEPFGNDVQRRLVLHIDTDDSCTDSESACSTSREPSPLTMEDELERRMEEKIERDNRQRVAEEERRARESEETEIREGFRKLVEKAIGPEKIAERKVKPSTASPSVSPASPTSSGSSSSSSRESSLLRESPEEDSDDGSWTSMFMDIQILDDDQMRQQMAIWRRWTRGISVMKRERKAREAEKKEEVIQKRHELIMEIVKKNAMEKEERELRVWEEKQELLILEEQARELLQQEHSRQAQQSAEYLRQMEEREAADRVRRVAKEEEKRKRREEELRRLAEKARLEEAKRKRDEEERILAEQERVRKEREEEEKKMEEEIRERELTEAERQRQLTLDRETRKSEERKQRAEAEERKKKEEEEKKQKAIMRRIEEEKKKRELAERMEELVQEEAKREAERRRLEREEQAAQRREEQQIMRSLALQRAQEEKVRQNMSIEERLKIEEEEKRTKMKEIQAVVDAQLTPPISPSQSKANKGAKRRNAKKIGMHRQSTLSEEPSETSFEPEYESRKAEREEERDVDEFQVAIPKSSRKKPDEIKFEPKIYVPTLPQLNQKDKKAAEIRKAFEEREAKEERRRTQLEHASREATPESSKHQGAQKHHYTKREKRPQFSREWIEFRNRQGQMSTFMHCLMIVFVIALVALGSYFSWSKILGVRKTSGSRQDSRSSPHDFVCPNTDQDPEMDYMSFLDPIEDTEDQPEPDYIFAKDRPPIEYNELNCLLWVFKPGPLGASLCVRTPAHYHLTSFHDDSIVSLTDQVRPLSSKDRDSLGRCMRGLIADVILNRLCSNSMDVSCDDGDWGLFVHDLPCLLIPKLCETPRERIFGV